MTRSSIAARPARLGGERPSFAAPYATPERAAGEDPRRFPPSPAGGWASPDYDAAPNRVEIEFRGGVGTLSVT